MVLSVDHSRSSAVYVPSVKEVIAIYALVVAVIQTLAHTEGPPSHSA
jgi:hypothetical protein